MDSAVQVGDFFLNKLIEKEDLSKYLDKDCTIHVISKYGKQNFTNYVNLTKLLEECILVISCEDDFEAEIDEGLNEVLESIATGESKPSEKAKSEKKIDKGKIIALHNAGWSSRKIADEMRCSVGTVYNTIKKHGRIETSGKLKNS